EAVAFRAQVRASAVVHGRSADHVKIFPGAAIITGATDDEAEAKLSAIRDLLTVEDALDYLGRFFDHHDFRQYDVDAPF
ncbi:LLM class flavin-dependent oxidoreductase, partial [Acinetobacter baumannii]